MKVNKKALALPMVALAIGAYTLPASAQVVYYRTSSSAVLPTSYVDTSVYTTTPTYTVVSQPVVVPTTSAYIDTAPRTNVLGRTIGGAAVGAGVGALGGLIYGAITRERLGRAALGGTAAGAAVGAGLQLLNGLFDSRTDTRLAAPGYYWY